MPLGLIDLQGQSSLVLCFDPDLEPIPVKNPGPLALASDRPVALPAAPACVVPLRQLSLRRDVPRLRALRPEQVVVHTTRNMDPRAILAAVRAGGRWFHLVDGRGSSFAVNARGALALAARLRLRKALARLPGAEVVGELLGVQVHPLWPCVGATVQLARLAIDRAGSRPPPPSASGPLRVTHYVGHLGPGGAERQLVYLARATRERGHAVEVLTTQALERDDAHYVEALAGAGIPARWTGWYDSRTLPAVLRRSPATALFSPGEQRRLLEHVHAENLLPLLEQLLAAPPDVLHCWLDQSNCLGAVTGLLAGVPRILVSTRNVNPEHFPRFCHPWFKETYRALADSPRVIFVANSVAGADDYAAWSGVPRERFHVVWNGFDAAALEPVPAAQRPARRRELGLDPQAFLVAGVFRLAPEKRPLEFLEVVARLRARHPGLQVAHVGVGELEPEVRAAIARLGLQDTVRLLGRLDDPWRVLGVCDASLLCSESEGCPNVSLESQALGVPVVLTRAGGAGETVDEGRTGYACPVGDVEALSARLLELARDPTRRAAMGQAGPAWIAERFSMPSMVEAHLRLYGVAP